MLGDLDHLRGALTALAGHLLSQVRETEDSAALLLSLNVVRHGDQVVVQVLPAAGSPTALPADGAPDAIQPGSTDLQVFNAVRLIDLMGGKVNVDPQGGRLTISLPAAAAL